MTTQRFRVLFRKGERIRYISHLDVLRFWERAIRRAELPLAYSQGFTPHPKIAFASPLPLGFTAEAEVMEVTLDERVDPEDFRRRLAAETSDDLCLVAIEEVAPSGPPPQAVLLWADYRAELPGVSLEHAREVVRTFMARAEFPWTEERNEKSRAYDLRAATAFLAASPAPGGVRLDMRLQADATLTARPEQIVAALFPGVEATSYARTGLVLESRSTARDLWRRRGQFVS